MHVVIYFVRDGKKQKTYKVLVLFWLLRTLPREGHSHFKMTGSILVENAWILVVRLQHESVAFSTYPAVFSIFQLIRTQKEAS